MGLTTVLRGNILLSALVNATLSPASVQPNTSAEQTFTVNGLQVGDFVNITKPTAQAGLAIGNARVSAANTIAITFANASAATVSPTAGEVYIIGVDRPENYPALPTMVSD